MIPIQFQSFENPPYISNFHFEFRNFAIYKFHKKNNKKSNQICVLSTFPAISVTDGRWHDVLKDAADAKLNWHYQFCFIISTVYLLNIIIISFNNENK